jgi:hypothetical protein
MSSPSKRKPPRQKKRPDPDLVAADEQAAALLAEDADSGGVVRRDWRKRAIGATSTTEAVATAGLVKLAHLRLGNRLAHLASQCATEAGMSRDSWLRSLVAKEVAARTGEPYEALLEPLGLHTTRRMGSRRIV